jgi:CRISPR-associated endonuclease Cas1
MPATKTVAKKVVLRKSATNANPQQATTNPSPAVIKARHGVVTLFGYGVSIRVERGHLILEDGIGADRFQGRFPRVGHGIERLIVIGNDGVVSLASLRWLADQHAAFVMLERDGSVLLTTGPARSSDAKLRRAQARANDTGAALEISRALINQKLIEQEKLARDKLQDSVAANEIAQFRFDLPKATKIENIRLLEAQGASAYWSAWQKVAINFARKDLPHVPAHWRMFGTRRSPISGSPRLAVNPANAMLNYLYVLLESEARLAAAALGLDPALGFLHLDTGYRDSLACDLMEPVRPNVDAYVLDWLKREPLKREWFFEQRDGNCRLMGPFAARLSETASMWRQAVAPYAEWVVHALATIGSDSARNNSTSTPLTRRHHREAQGKPPLPPAKRPPRPECVCRICGVGIAHGKRYCRPCQITFAIEQVTIASPAGRVATVSATAQAQRSETKRLNDLAIKNWDPNTKPAWLTEEAYTAKIQPLLAVVRPADIMNAIGVSWLYASQIRRGMKRPHARHWATLAELVGIPPDGQRA